MSKYFQKDMYQLYEYSKVKKIYAVMSGKGGVGKSMVTSLLASSAAKQGQQVAVLDADILGPSMGKVFGITDKTMSNGQVLLPAITKTGIQLMNTNMMLDSDETPVVWRAPLILGLIKQFYEEVYWEDVDTMFIDLPPGTGDISLTILQSLPVDGVFIVTTPQDLVSMIVAKSINMVKMLNIPIVGIIENFSYVTCECCQNKVQLFPSENGKAVSEKFNVPILTKLPIDPHLASLSDKGDIESAQVDAIDEIVKQHIIGDTHG